MTPQQLSLVLFALVVVALLAMVAACGGGGGDNSNFQGGQLTDPRTVPTATPWDEPPEIFIIDPNAITPISGGGPTPGPTGQGGEPGVCGPTYTIASGDTFSLIAERCNLSTQAIKDANPGVDPLTLHPGDVINLPTSPESSPSP